jgi:hypothetical protein
MAIGAARYHPLVHRMRLQPLDRLDADHAFMLGLVREHRRTCDVADRVDAGHVGPAELVDDDAAAVGLHTELFQSEAFDIADDAGGGDDAVGRDLFGFAARFDRCRDAVAVLVELRHLGAGHDPDALLFERLVRERGDLRVLDRQDLRQHLDDGHVRTHGAVERRELDADRPRADDQQRLRHPVGVHCLEIGPDQLLVRFETGQRAGPRTGRDDDVLGLIRTRSGGILRRRRRRSLHGDLARRVDRRFAPDHGDLVLLHQEADAGVHATGDAARALDDGGSIEIHIVGGQPVVLRVPQVVEDLRRAQQRLGRNAAPIRADAAEKRTLHDRGPEAELRGADHRHIAARSGPNHDNVECGFGHRGPRLTRSQRRDVR